MNHGGVSVTDSKIPVYYNTDVDKLHLFKLEYGGLVLITSKFLTLPPCCLKNDALFKSNQRDSKIIILLCKSKSLTHFVSVFQLSGVHYISL